MKRKRRTAGRSAEPGDTDRTQGEHARLPLPGSVGADRNIGTIAAAAVVVDVDVDVDGGGGTC